ncbi:MAG TPA: U32 family peptidase [Candidatus Limnocylindrales bacterium]|nr:U32 family peptidase [Candidatus Limnocylindrales bacterium]
MSISSGSNLQTPEGHQAFSQPAGQAIRVPELLAPAGDWECAKAAVENGADAIYFGLEKFNARMRAHNFTEADLPRLMDFLHRRGVKGYVTFNTLVFENEMAEAEQYTRAIIAAGVDAAIVQDVGICRLIRQLSPDFPIHVSTQMTVTSLAGIEFARKLGCNLVVLARECSLKEIESIQATQIGKSNLMPLEVFVHGALCVAYSGQCLTSEALGGRSANRGECAQACRMPYDLLSDGQPVALGDRKYLLSPQDLAGLELLPDLARVGVASLKIEGRLKSPEYVANITRVYRRALDELVAAGGPPAREPGILPGGGNADSDRVQYEMEMAFSRGLYTGWFRGINNQQLVHGRFGKKRGVYLGEVVAIRKDGVCVCLEGPLKPGDGVVFDAGRPEEQEEGGRVYEMKPAQPGKDQPNGALTVLGFGTGDLNLKRIRIGDKLWKTSDPELERQLRLSFQGNTPQYRRPITVEVHGAVGKPLTLIGRDELGHTVQLDSAMPLVAAEKQPLDVPRLKAQLGRLGGTSFELRKLQSFLQGSVLLPLSELNRLRRDMVSALEQLRAQPLRWTLLTESAPPQPAEQAPKKNGHTNRLTCLNVLVRSLPQLEAILERGVGTVYCDFEDPKKYRDAVKLFRGSERRVASAEIFVAPPRIFKTGEEWTLKQVRSCEADGYLIRNYDHLQYFAADRKIGDYSLNIANHRAAEYFKNGFHLERVTPSYDLNFTQLEALLQAAPPEWFEVTIHQHMPMFHMEHCLFCAFLSQGTDYTNCGRPCDKHDLKLRDRAGAQHPVKADSGCRNTVFNALAQTGAEYVERMMALGVRYFRIEFVNETADQVVSTLQKYQLLLQGKLTGAELWRDLKLMNQLGVTRGQIGVRK